MAAIRPAYKIDIIVLLVLVCAGIYSYVNLGNWLLVSDPEPIKIDLIFTFAGGPYRDDHAVDLLKKHPEAKWLASTNCHSGIIDKCLKAGIDTTRVTTIDTCKSTLAKIKILKNFIAKNKWARSVGLVSSEWHMRRIALFVFKQGLPGARFAYLPVPLEVTGPERAAFGAWRKTAATKVMVESEWMKIVFHMVGLRR